MTGKRTDGSEIGTGALLKPTEEFAGASLGRTTTPDYYDDHHQRL